MIPQLSVTALALALFGVFGLPVAALLRPRSAGVMLAIPAFGVALLSSSVALLYGLGLGVPQIDIAVLVAALALLLLFRRLWLAGSGGLVRHPVAATLLLLFVGILLSPILFGTFDLTVFQGNLNDHFTYISSAVVYAKLPMAEVARAAQTDFLQNPLLVAAQYNLDDRPAVSILFGAVAGLVPKGIGTGGYAFLCSLLIIGMLVFAGLLLELFGRPGNRWDRVVAALFAGAYACGFWGQYSADIDAWSAVSVMPVLLAAWMLVLSMLAREQPERGYGFQGLVPALGLLMAGALYLYPEGASFHALMLIAVVLLASGPAAWQSMVGRRLGQAEWAAFWAGRARANLAVVASAALAIALVLPSWHGTMDVLYRHADKAMTDRVNWWTGFDAYLFGMDTALSKSMIADASAVLQSGSSKGLIVPTRGVGLLTGVSGILGVYFLTPLHAETIDGLDAAKAVLLLAVFLGAAVGIGLGLVRGDRRYRLLLGAVMAGLVGTALLLEQRQAWAAGKALSYTAPLLCLAITAPGLMAHGERHRLRRWALAVAPIFWCIAQACFIGLALFSLGHGASVRLPAPYPGWEGRGLKADHRWDIDQAIARMQQCREVQILAPDQPFRQYSAIHLFEQGIRYFYTETVSLARPGEGKAGLMTAVDVPAQCRLVEPSIAANTVSGAPPAGVRSFPDGLLAPNLFFAGISQDGWLGTHANTRLALSSGSNGLHLTGEVTDAGPGIATAKLSVKVDSVVASEQALKIGAFDLAIPISSAPGARTISLDLVGLETLPPDARSKVVRLTSITLEIADRAVGNDGAVPGAAP